MNLQQITQFFQVALESSFYLAPGEPGLTYEELLEVGRRVELQNGEMEDAVLNLGILVSRNED